MKNKTARPLPYRGKIVILTPKETRTSTSESCINLAKISVDQCSPFARRYHELVVKKGVLSRLAFFLFWLPGVFPTPV
jgi:hypothetical protein